MEKYFEINESPYNIKCKIYCNDIKAVRRPTVFCHGFGGHKDNKAAARFADRLLSSHKDAALVAFDWPCHGDDVRKRLTLADCGEYLDLVLKYLRTQLDCQDIYGYSTSFGSYLTLKYIVENGSPFKKAALRCPAVNMYEVITGSIITPDELAALSKGKDVLVGFDRKIKISPQFLSELREADISRLSFLDQSEGLLILHGTKDEIVPFEAVRAFADDNLIEFIPVENADHRFVDPRKMDAAIKYILDFFQL